MNTTIFQMFSIEHLNRLRSAELHAVRDLLPTGGRLLEIGAGTGQQALDLQKLGFEVSAVDLPESDYSDARVFPVKEYDGRALPYEDASFDVVFSSNVLEHIAQLPEVHAEVLRVLRPGGTAVHILPTHAWRLWSMITAYPAVFKYFGRAVRRPSGQSMYEFARQVAVCVVHPKHGDRGTGLSELFTFRPGWWCEHFRQHGFAVRADRPVGIFYTGEMLIGGRLGLQSRRKLAGVLGSACHVFQLSRSD